LRGGDHDASLFPQERANGDNPGQAVARASPQSKVGGAEPKETKHENRKHAFGCILRVRPKTSSRITEFSQHEADGCEFQERESAAIEIFPVLGEATAAVKPGDRAFDDPTLGQLYEPLGLRGSFDDFGFGTGQDFGERVAEDWPLMGAVGEQLLQEWKLTKQRRQKQDAAVAILNTGGMNDGVQ
jgi:hypothetical protein